MTYESDSATKKGKIGIQLHGTSHVENNEPKGRSLNRGSCSGYYYHLNEKDFYINLFFLYSK